MNPMILRRRMANAGNGYTMVDYIANPNGGYIVIDDLYLTRQDNVTCRFIAQNYQSGDKVVFGCYTTSSNKHYWIDLYGHIDYYPRFGTRIGGDYTSMAPNGNVKTIKVTNGVWVFIENDTIMGTWDYSSEPDFTCITPFTIFARLDGQRSLRAKLLGVTIDGRFNGVPVVDSNGIYGLYDTIGHEFYGSYNGILFTGGYL